MIIIITLQLCFLYKIRLTILIFTDINECQSNPCLHEGTCVDDVNEYHCQCLSDWQGPQCQLSKTECSGSPCVNAHTCEDMLGDYICHCLKGWKGKNCDISMFIF